MKLRGFDADWEACQGHCRLHVLCSSSKGCRAPRVRCGQLTAQMLSSTSSSLRLLLKPVQRQGMLIQETFQTIRRIRYRCPLSNDLEWRMATLPAKHVPRLKMRREMQLTSTMTWNVGTSALPLSSPPAAVAAATADSAPSSFIEPFYLSGFFPRQALDMVRKPEWRRCKLGM